MRKFFLLAALVASFVVTKTASAVQYGDLYSVEWCPCNPEEQYNDQGSVVLGKTVMCPCDSMYDGYNSTMEKDLRKLQHKTKKTLEKARNFKYYVGVDYNKSQVDTAEGNLIFNDIRFTDVNGLEIPAALTIDHQDNIGFVIGTRPHSNLGIEAFYNRAYSKNEVTQLDTTSIGHPDRHLVNSFVTQYQAFGIDILGYLPVTDYFDFIAFVGMGQYMLDNEATFTVNYLEDGKPDDVMNYDFSEDKLAWRIGAGIQFNIARGLVLRSMYRYIKLNTDTINAFHEYSIGLRFLF